MQIEANRIVGANDAGRRHDKDFYQTPPDVTQALLNFLQLPKGQTIWECACGKGDMADTICENGYKCIRTDLAYGEDFLTMEPKDCDMIITNPPFSKAEEFIRRAWEIGKPFAFLLKSQYWHAARRYALFRKMTPSYVLPLTWRPDFCGGGAPLMDVMWVCWNPEDIPNYVPAYMPLPRPKGEHKCG